MNKDLIRAMEDFEKIIHRADDLIDEMRMVNNRMKDRLQTIKYYADKQENPKSQCYHYCPDPQSKVCTRCGEIVF